jgi:hypothetical protein
MTNKLNKPRRARARREATPPPHTHITTTPHLPLHPPTYPLQEVDVCEDGRPLQEVWMVRGGRQLCAVLCV